MNEDLDEDEVVHLVITGRTYHMICGMFVDMDLDFEKFCKLFVSYKMK